MMILLPRVIFIKLAGQFERELLEVLCDPASNRRKGRSSEVRLCILFPFFATFYPV